MKRPLLLLTLLIPVALAQTTVHVSGYTRKDGTVVSGYDRTVPGRATPPGSTGSSLTTVVSFPPSSSGQQPAKPMTNQDVIACKAAGLSDQMLIAKIKQAPGNYALGVAEIIGLRAAKLSEPVIEAMLASPTIRPAPVPDATAPVLGDVSMAQGVVAPMTNRDVLALKAAGLSDEIVIAKIKQAGANYDLGVADIIGMRTAKLSDPIIEAMLSAAPTLQTAPAPGTNTRVIGIDPFAPGVAGSMTNQDVLALKAAGLSDETVIAKIKRTPAGYRIGIEQIVELETAPLSRALIQAMVVAVAPVGHRSALPANCIIRIPDSSSAATGPAQKVEQAVSQKSKPASQSKRAQAQTSVVAPATSPSSLVSVNVFSTPGGAGIIVDGYVAGTTPGAVKLAPGTYNFLLNPNAPGASQCSQQVTVEPGRSVSFTAALSNSQ